MKNTRVLIPFIAFIILIVMIIMLAVVKSILTSPGTAKPDSSSTVNVLTDEASISNAKIFFQGPITALPEIPQKTVKEPKDTKGLSIYWIANSSETNGNDTCTLYDNTTKQIYATRYRTELSGRTNGIMYYQNKKVEQAKSLDLLSSACFQ